MERLPKTLGDIRKYHFERLGFELFLKSFRSKSNEKIESVRRVALMMKVQAHIFNRDFLGWVDDEARVLYVNMQALKNEYNVKNHIEHV